MPGRIFPKQNNSNNRCVLNKYTHTHTAITTTLSRIRLYLCYVTCLTCYNVTNIVYTNWSHPSNISLLWCKYVCNGTQHRHRHLYHVNGSRLDFVSHPFTIVRWYCVTPPMIAIITGSQMHPRSKQLNEKHE